MTASKATTVGASRPHLFGPAPLRVWAALLRENGGVSRPY